MTPEETKLLPELTERIGTGLVRLSQGMRGMLWNQARQEGLSPSQAQALLALQSSPEPLTVGSLAEQFGIAAPTASELAGTLERKGYIERRHSTTDRRQVHLCLTDAGEMLAGRLIGWNGLLGEAIESLQVEDREAFYRTLLSLLSTLERSGAVHAHACPACAYFSACCGGSDERVHLCSLTQTRMIDAELRVDCPDFILQS